jgi:amino acid adenylation domain-containing protein
MTKIHNELDSPYLVSRRWSPRDPSDSLISPCVHRLFEAQVELAPDRIAVRSQEGCWNYRELNRRANQLAHHLRALGVGPETLVGICLKRSFDLVAGLLGILKAGGAYVPLDPTYPRNRLSFMLTDSQVPVLLTSEDLLDRLPESSATPVFMDRDWPEIRGGLDENPAGGATLDNLAYVIYTSGSTGLPKGALIVHRGLTNYLSWCTEAYNVADGAGAPVHSSISFDLTVTSLFAPLMVGRRVDLLGEDLGVEQLAAALEKNSGYSLVKITPAHLQLLGRQLAPQDVAGRTRAFVIGGEQLMAEHIAFWREHAPDTLLFNEYGPTETVVGCCVYQVPVGEPVAGVIPIGRPIAGTQLYILDEDAKPLPDGRVGELYIGGAGVARGYLNREELTARKFLPDPFSSRPGARLYRTGDLCRRRQDGEIEYIGRTDHQVKIHGYRIEPGEIEAALLQHGAVREAVVVAREDAPGIRHLVAYVGTNPDQPSPTMPELRNFLRGSLPEPMVPSAIVILDALPLSISGKVDRSALPDPEEFPSGFEHAIVEPVNEYEIRLRIIWEEVLGVRPIGVEDDFLEMGGDSLRTIALLVRIEKEFGKSFSPSILLQGGTIRRLARLLAEEPNPPQESPLVQFRNGSKRPLFFLPGIGGIVVELMELVSVFHPGRPIYSFRTPGLDGAREPMDSIESLAAVYSEAIRSAQPQGPYLLAGYSFGAIVAFEMAVQLQAAGERVDYLAILDQLAPGEDRKRWWNPAYTGCVAFKFFRWGLSGFFRPGRAEHAAAVVRSLSSFLQNQKRRERDSGGRDLGADGPVLDSEITAADELPRPVSLVIAAHLRAESLYRPRIYPGRLFLYRVPTEYPRFRPNRTDMGWGRHIRGEVEVRFLAGTHLTFHKDPHARFLAGLIEKHLDTIES